MRFPTSSKRSTHVFSSVSIILIEKLRRLRTLLSFFILKYAKVTLLCPMENMSLFLFVWINLMPDLFL